MVTVEKSMTSETYAEVTNGIKIARGYSSNLFINNQKKDECVLEDVKILVCDAEINSILQIENILKPVINNGDKLLIIAPCSTNVVNTIAANVVRNGLQFCNIQPPQFGYKQHELMQDIAMSVGAKYYSEKTGDDLSLIMPKDLGKADKVIIGEHSSVIFKKDNSTPELNQRIKELKVQRKNTKEKTSNEFIKERIASLAGAIGCIYVGGNSEMEQKEKYDRVDDSVCAVRSALEEGILAGGGIALFRESMMLRAKTKNQDEKDAVLILESALRSPLIQILDNAGKNKEKVVDQLYTKKYNYGYDVKNNKYGDMYELGVIDPLKVTKNALTNAVSVATTILSTNAIVTNMRA